MEQEVPLFSEPELVTTAKIKKHTGHIILYAYTCCMGHKKIPVFPRPKPDTTDQIKKRNGDLHTYYVGHEEVPLVLERLG